MPSICSFSIQFGNLTAQLSAELGLKCRDSGTHCLVALLIGEGTVGCAQGQRIRHGFLALRDALATVEKAAGKLLESVKLFDVYKGKGIPEGKKSVAYSLSMRAPDRTLTDEECDKAMRAAISALETEFGAQLRG